MHVPDYLLSNIHTIHVDNIYKSLLSDVLTTGSVRGDRTNTGTFSKFGPKFRVDLNNGFPLLTTKKVFWRGVVHELLWFLRGESNIQYLKDHNVSIWDDWADEKGEVGPMYGPQLREWTSYEWDLTTPTEVKHDQVAMVIDSIKRKPESRRHVMSTWNVGDLGKMNLHPCHGVAIQFYVETDRRLSCKMYVRSNDLFLGCPFNIASYALLTHMIARLCGLGVGYLHYTIGDAHLYSNHTKQASTQLKRDPYILPQLEITGVQETIDDFKFEHFKLKNYKHHDPIKAEVAV